MAKPAKTKDLFDDLPAQAKPKKAPARRATHGRLGERRPRLLPPMEVVFLKPAARPVDRTDPPGQRATRVPVAVRADVTVHSRDRFGRIYTFLQSPDRHGGISPLLPAAECSGYCPRDERRLALAPRPRSGGLSFCAPRPLAVAGYPARS